MDSSCLETCLRDIVTIKLKLRKLAFCPVTTSNGLSVTAKPDTLETSVMGQNFKFFGQFLNFIVSKHTL